MPKKTWFVPVEWTEIGLAEIEAGTLEEAINLAKRREINLPDNSSYLEDSLSVSPNDIEEIMETYNY